MSWSSYRVRKRAVVPVLVTVALIMMRNWPEGSLAWAIGGFVAIALGLVYIAEEAVRIGRGEGRRCGQCDREVRLRAFRVRNTCPHCGSQL